MIMVTADLWEHKSITCVRGACSRFGGGKYCHFSLRLKKKRTWATIEMSRSGTEHNGKSFERSVRLIASAVITTADSTQSSIVM